MRLRLKNGGEGIGYRCQQLANAAVFCGLRELVRLDGSAPVRVDRLDQMVSNVALDSALTNARALMFFLGPPKLENDVSVDHYLGRWDAGDRLIDLREALRDAPTADLQARRARRVSGDRSW